MKVVTNKKTGEILYRQQPEFEEGQGIEVAASMGLGAVKDLVEEEIKKEDWDAHIEKTKPKDYKGLFAAASTLDDKIKVIAEYLKIA